MKKTYKNPSYKVITLDSRDLMAQSPNGITTIDELGETQLVKENVTKQGGSLWDDEW